jgi:hypothetical protein
MSINKDTQHQLVDSGSDYAERIRALIEADCVDEARALLRKALHTDADDRDLRALEEVLKPPRTRARLVTDADRRHEFEWIHANREAYRGRWVAIQGDELVADAASFGELQSRIKNLEKAPLVHRIQ